MNIVLLTNSVFEDDWSFDTKIKKQILLLLLDDFRPLLILDVMVRTIRKVVVLKKNYTI